MVEVRPLRLKDVAQMARWGKHADPRFLAYDFLGRTRLEFLSWFLVKRQPFRKWVYGVFLENRMIGYISYKNFDRHLRKGEMGISFDPLFLSRGYGTQALYAYLALVFKRFSIDRVWLKTAVFNARAIRCYEKSGFVAYDRKKEPYEDQSVVLTLVNRWPEFFEYHDDLVWTEYVYMAIEKRDFEK
jgi:RimJ/RimL family protein N-acetyltransferase